MIDNHPLGDSSYPGKLPEVDVNASQTDELVKSRFLDGVVKSGKMALEFRGLKAYLSTPQGQRDEVQRRYWTFYGAVKTIRFRFRKVLTLLQRILLSGPALPQVIYYLARNGKPGRIRLEATFRLGNEDDMIQLSHEAAEQDIRFKAALLAGEQAALTAFALNAWDIAMGKAAVRHIDNRFLLMRIARSARQDPIRLAAAMKVPSPVLLYQIARSATDIHVRWQIARILDDPDLLAEISLFKTSNQYLSPLRLAAHQALLNHLDGLQRRGDQAALKNILFSQPNMSIKLEAFLRLSPDAIRTVMLDYLARHRFEQVPPDLINRMIEKIRSAGWQIDSRAQTLSCPNCLGKGVLSDRSFIVHQRRCDCEVLPCTECDGNGHLSFKMLTCSYSGRGAGEEPVIFRLPLYPIFL